MHAPTWQSALDAHAVKHAVPPALHLKLPGHAPVVLVHAPLPSHSMAVEIMLPVHDCAAPHDVDAGHFEHAPALHLPSVPQVLIAVVAHIPRGSAAPFVALAHVPSLPPVSAALHALHALVQALSQHLPSTQNPLAHVPPVPHAAPMGDNESGGVASGCSVMSGAASITLKSGTDRSGTLASEYGHCVLVPFR
jgi:hypothetical protein